MFCNFTSRAFLRIINIFLFKYNEKVSRISNLLISRSFIQILNLYAIYILDTGSTELFQITRQIVDKKIQFV
jgi:hypothetical protein